MRCKIDVFRIVILLGSLLNPAVRISLLSAIVFPTILFAQSDFRLSTAEMPRLEDALIPLPAPMADTVVRESLDGTKAPEPKPDEILKKVLNGLKTRQFAETLPMLEYLEKARPSEPDVLILRGCVYAESGHPDAAEQLFRKAILIAPAHPWARLNLAEAQLSQKKFAEAERTLSLLAATRPESEVVRFKLILALALQNKIAAAEQELQELEEYVSTPSYLFAAAAIAFASGKDHEGRASVDKAKSKYSETQTSYFLRALTGQNWILETP